MKKTSLLAAGTFLAATLLAAEPATAAPDLSGAWVLVEDASDDVEDRFDGKLRRERYPTPLGDGSSAGPRNARDATQEGYWETVRSGKERGSLKNLRRLGSAYPLVKAARLDIAAAADGYAVTYDGELPRFVRPNPAGRIFSASGEELVVDTLGHSLAYWDKDTLVVENDPPNGGKVVEKFRLGENPHRLHHSVKVRLRVLEEPVTVRHVFEREDAQPQR